MRERVKRSASRNFLSDPVLLLIERLQLAARDVAAVLAGVEAFFLADELVLIVQGIGAGNADPAVLELLIDPKILRLRRAFTSSRRGCA